MACDATSGVFVRCCRWHSSVTVHTANRWQRNALAVGTNYDPWWAPWLIRTELILCNHMPRPTRRITPHPWITSSHPKGWVGYRRRPAIAGQKPRSLLRCVVKFWQCFYIHLNLKDQMSGCDCLYTHIYYQATGSTVLQKTSAGPFLSCCAAEHVAAAAV